MTTLDFSYSSSNELPSSLDETDVMIICGSTATFQQLTPDHPVLQVTGLFHESTVNTLKLAASSRLSPSTDDGSAVELFFPPQRKVTLGALPINFSRHNTPSRSHGVAAIVKGHKSSSSVNQTIVLIPSSRDHALAQALAVSRQYPLFSMKSSSLSSSTTTTKSHIHVIIHLMDPDITKDESLLADIKEAASGIRLCQRLVDSPPNILHTDSYVAEALDIAKTLGCGIEVIQGEELDKRGFGGIAGVGRASAHPPAIVVLSHIPSGMENSKSICIVGKGIVYDTGGLSIKTPTTSMAGMKVDMGGSAAVLGAFVASVKRNVPHRLHAILCIAENSVGPLATRPDDIHTFLSGKTVEINNTDAEGRLVLADGCYYAASAFNPFVIMDMATLTGAQGITTGRYHSAIFCNDDDLESIAVKAGKYTGDLTFPLLYCPEFHRVEYKSQVADMKNSVADRSNAQSSCAAQFIGNHIESFINNGGKWLHVDMAYPAVSGERSTGYGVALFFHLIQQLSQQA